MGALAGAVDQADLVQAVYALLHGDEVRERLEAADVERVGALQQGRPGRLGQVIASGSGQAGVLVPVVGADDEAVALMVHGVFVACPARGDEAGLGVQIIGRDQVRLGGHMVGGVDDDVLLGCRSRDAHEKARIRLFVNDGVLGCRLAQPMAAHLVGAPVIIDHRVEKRRVVRGPYRGADGVFDGILEQFVAAEVLDHEAKTLRAIGVRAVGHQLAAVAHRQCSKAEVLKALCQLGLIENRLGILSRCQPSVRDVRRPA